MATSPLKAIRENCLQCVGSANEVNLCPCEHSCPLWPYRSGHSPRKRILTDEQRQAATERLKKAREEKNKNS